MEVQVFIHIPKIFTIIFVLSVLHAHSFVTLYNLENYADKICAQVMVYYGSQHLYLPFVVSSCFDHSIHVT